MGLFSTKKSYITETEQYSYQPVAVAEGGSLAVAGEGRIEITALDEGAIEQAFDFAKESYEETNESFSDVVGLAEQTLYAGYEGAKLVSEMTGETFFGLLGLAEKGMESTEEMAKQSAESAYDIAEQSMESAYDMTEKGMEYVYDITERTSEQREESFSDLLRMMGQGVASAYDMARDAVVGAGKQVKEMGVVYQTATGKETPIDYTQLATYFLFTVGGVLALYVFVSRGK